MEIKGARSYDFVLSVDTHNPRPSWMMPAHIEGGGGQSQIGQTYEGGQPSVEIPIRSV